MDKTSDLYQCANQLASYVDEGTPNELAVFLIRESDRAEHLADTIQKLRDENARLREALKPFTNEVANVYKHTENHIRLVYFETPYEDVPDILNATVGDLRRAKEALDDANS